MKTFLLTFITIILTHLAFSQDFISNKKYEGDPLFDFITEWWRTPYRYGGSTKRGVDCSAFTGKLAKEVYDVNLPRTASEQYKKTFRVKKSELKDGDLVFFRNNIKSGWHVGVYLSDGWFVHSKSRTGVTFSNINEGYYRKVFYGAGRIKHAMNMTP